MPVRILLADKSITIQKVVEMLFSGRDYEVVCVSDGETALSEAERMAPDVVLADVDLPRIDGYGFAARLKTKPAFSHTPVILMMSRDDIYDTNRGKQSGIFDNIAKPFESQELIGKVKKAIASAPPKQAESAPAKPVAAAPRPAAPPVPPVMTPPAMAAPKPAPAAATAKPSAPADIFDIISEAPSPEDLKKTTIPVEEESLFEVEPVVEEMDEPLAAELEKSLPVGAKAMEEMRAGLGLMQEQEEPRSEIAELESFDIAVEEPEKPVSPPKPTMPAAAATPPPILQPIQPPTLSESELRQMAQATMTQMAKEIFTKLPPVQQPTLPESELRALAEKAMAATAKEAFAKLTPPQAPMLSASDVWSMAEATVSKMAADAFAQLPPVQQPAASEQDLRRITENIAAQKVAEFLEKAPAAPHVPVLPESELRSMAEVTISKMALDVFKDMAPPIPKISEETVRKGIEDAVSSIAKQIAREVIEKVAWEVIPPLAEYLIKAEIERLKAEP